MTVDVDPQVYFRSSSSARFTGQTVDGALSSLSSGLVGSAGMAGSDDTGKTFGEGYDPSAKELLTAAAGLVDMSINAADLIRVSGLNHQNAERASTLGAPPPASEPIPTEPTTAVPTVPSAYGYGGNEPTGAIATAWQYIQQWVGYVWPNGDPAALEAAARAWNSAATSVRNAKQSLDWATDDLSGQQSPEIPAATSYLSDLKAKYDSVAGACNNIEASCNNLSQSIQDAHAELIAELAEFAAEFVVGEIAFGVLFEVGGELWGNAAMAARAAVIAQRCARIIEKLIELARGAARVAKAAAEAIANVVKTIKSAVAALVTRTNLDRNVDALLKYTRQALDEFDQGLIGLSDAQVRALENNPNLYNAFKGSVLDARVKELVRLDESLKDLTTTGNFKYGPDFPNVASNPSVPWYDLTTQGGWEAKLAQAKYEGTHGGPGGGIIWDAPGGPSYVPPR